MKNKRITDLVKLYFCIYFMVMFFGILSYPMFGVYPEYLFSPVDRYADLIKAAMSIVPQNDLHKVKITDYVAAYRGVYNNYVTPDTTNTIFHHMPLAFLIFIAASFFLAAGVSPTVVAYGFFGFVVVLFVFLLGRMIAKNKINFLSLALFFAICFTSYPFLFALQRCNIPALINGFALIFLALAPTAMLSFGSIFVAAVSLNIRPNSLLFMVANVGRQGWMKWFSFLALCSAAIFSVAYFTANFLISNYNIESFLISLDKYASAYVENGAGDAYNSSLWAVNNLLRKIATYDVLRICILGFTFFSVALAFLVAKNRGCKLFFAASLYMFLTPVFADYHLLIFLAPVAYYCLLSEGFDMYDQVIFVASLLVLLPKFTLHIHSFTGSVVFNPLLCVVVALIVLFASVKHLLSNESS